MSNLILKSFQEETKNYGIKHKYFICALEMGLGKSPTSLAIAVETKSKTLIVCPSYLKLKWESEINKFFPDKVVSLFNSDKEFYELWDTDFAIVSYSFVETAEALFEWADMVIADECHFLKELKTKRSEAFHKHIYQNSIKRLALLTGTPIQNRVYEFYSLIALCNYNPELEESGFLKKFPSYVDFANYFSHLIEYEIIVKGGRRRKVQKWEGYRNVEELKRWLNNIYIRFEADKVLDLPPSVDIEVPMLMEDRPELLEAFYAFSEDEDNNSIVSNIKAEAALVKAPYTVDYVKGLVEQGKQVVVYSDHRASAHFIADKLGYAKAIDGTMDMKYRQAQADRFQAGELQVVVATITSFSTGIDLFRASNMVFNDSGFIPGNMKQAKARIRRIGSNGTCFYHYIIGSYQDEKIYEILNNKEETIKAVT